ncbi:carbohydrate kinase family protein [Candidatus Woesearchaeota archaeon]|nr:carbohydrate kinase family protein [Candidatus Woesearchaeota archaeon]
MLDIISIGDVTEDVFVQVSDGVTLHGSHLDFEFPTKLGIEKVDKLVGGNAGNIAIGSARLGLKSALYAEVGADSQGDLIYKSMKDNKVSTKYFFRKKGQKTNYSVVLYYKGDRTILVHHEKRDYKFPKLGKATFIYLTSMAKGSEKIFNPLLKYLKKTNAKMGFNPGTHQLNLGLKKIKKMLEATEVVFLNVEETQKLLGTKKRDLMYLTKKLQETGPKIACVTDGPKGSYCYDGSRYLFCPIYDVPIYERTGCGDAFSVGFMSALCNGKDVDEAMKWGTISSAGVVQKVGPQEGLVQLSLMKKALKGNPKFMVREFNTAEVKKGNVYKPVMLKKF